jgi:hypothetical protein
MNYWMYDRLSIIDWRSNAISVNSKLPKASSTVYDCLLVMITTNWGKIWQGATSLHIKQIGTPIGSVLLWPPEDLGERYLAVEIGVIR